MARQASTALADLLRVSLTLENVAHQGGVVLLELRAPAQVTLAAFRVGTPWDLPAPQVVRACGQPQRVAGLGLQALHPLTHELGVGQLLGMLFAVDTDALGIAGIRSIDGPKGRLQLLRLRHRWAFAGSG